MNIGVIGTAGGSIGAAVLRKLEAHPSFIPVELVCDVRHEESITSAMKRAPQLEGLVYAAGIYKGALLREVTKEDWEQVLAVNLTGAMLSLKQYAIWGHEGTAVLIGASAAHLPAAGSAAYCVSKAAMGTLVNIASQELEPFIHPIQLDPGIVVGTGMYNDTVKRSPLSEKELLGKRLANVPAARAMTKDEVADWVVFLLEQGSYASGSQLKVDGGKVGFSRG